MAIIYEINPPRTGQEDRLPAQMGRVEEISSFCGGIHVTDSVLGTGRVPAMQVARLIREKHRDLQVTISLRVRDRTEEEVDAVAREAAEAGIDGVLVLMGDPPKEPRPDSGLVPSRVAARLASRGSRIRIYLSLPSRPDFAKIRKKIDARPYGFVTQVIRSEEQAARIASELRPRGFRIVPCVLLPSEKNASSARFLGLDWSHYREDPAGFISRVHAAAGDVLITSPSDFAAARDTLRSLATA